MDVKYEEYEEDMSKFFAKHNHDFKIDTSPITSKGTYSKTYMFSDGAVWYEHMSPVKEEVDVEVHNTKVSVKIKLLRTEYYSSENSKSKYYYEKF